MTHPAYGVLRPVTATASVLLARNPSPMTLEGTNSWVLRAPERDGCVIVDPGPADDVHLAALAAQGPVEAILLTHRHPDHTDGLARLRELTGAPSYAADPSFGSPLPDVLDLAGLRLRVLRTPGHTSDSVSFVLPDAERGGDGAVLTGDTILGRGTTVVAHPDGALRPYLDSLRGLAALGSRPVLPGHGPELPDLAGIATAYLEHRQQRLDQVRAALATAHSPAEVVAIVYADVDRALWPAAELSVRAQLDYLDS